jgi:hypothetical protein
MEQYSVYDCHASVDQILWQLQVNVRSEAAERIQLKLEQADPETVYVFLLKEGGLLVVTYNRNGLDNVPRL